MFSSLVVADSFETDVSLAGAGVSLEGVVVSLGVIVSDGVVVVSVEGVVVVSVVPVSVDVDVSGVVEVSVEPLVVEPELTVVVLADDDCLLSFLCSHEYLVGYTMSK